MILCCVSVCIELYIGYVNKDLFGIPDFKIFPGEHAPGPP